MQRHQGFAEPTLDAEVVRDVEDAARRARGAVLTMTSLAASGHPGGSLSSMEVYSVLYGFARLDPERPSGPGRDRVVVSHGHTSPAVYAVLAENGFFPRDEAIAHFRQAGSAFEGHVERGLPGVEWSTGNLGQGLSAGVGFALASRLTGKGWHTFVAMSDGEQHKGQVAEARRLAVKERLSDLTVVVDLNGIQISGRTYDVMPVAVPADFMADGWGVIECDGHDVRALYEAVATAVRDVERPYAIIARTVIGKGVSFMEGRAEYHGRALDVEEYIRAMAELGLMPELERYAEMRSRPSSFTVTEPHVPAVELRGPSAREHEAGSRADARSAWGQALVGLAEENPSIPIAVLDCDLAVSVKTDGFARRWPASFVQCGVGEHNAATVAGALSVSGVLTFLADFGVFGVDEVYNQQRLNDVNGAAVRLVITHCGLDVGEDGKTHQCLDYVGAFRNMFGWKVIVPADADQTFRAICSAASMPGNVVIAMGRSKLPGVVSRDGVPLFGGEYEFEYGEVTWARSGSDGVVLTMGTVAHAAVEASDLLLGEGLEVAVGIVSTPLDLDDVAMGRAMEAPWVLVAEDHHWRTGLWASVAEWAALRGVHTPELVPLGVKGFGSSGSSPGLLRGAGLDAAGIAAKARELARR